MTGSATGCRRAFKRGHPGVSEKCPVCDGGREEVFVARVLDKYLVKYFFCHTCGFLQTERPYWLGETYDRDMGDFDADIVARNAFCARRLAGLLYFVFGRDCKYLDFAGGYGLLTRTMRDIGFGYYWSDAYTKNLFAKGFEAHDGQSQYVAVSAFEVLEHVHDPVELLGRLRREFRCDAVIFSTEVFSGQPPHPAKWAYYGLGGGQHVSFYRFSTLQALAERLDARFYSNQRIHMIAWRPVSAPLYSVLTSRASVFIELFVRSRMSPRTAADRSLLLERVRSLTERVDSEATCDCPPRT